MLAVLVLAGCGGGSLSRQEYVSRANAMCVAFTKELSAIPITKLDDAKTSKRINADARKLYDRLHALKPPSSLRDERDRWFGAVDAQAELTTKFSHGKPDFVVTKAQRMKLDAAQKRVYDAAVALGVTKCASKP